MYQITLGSRENEIVKTSLGFNTITHRPLKFRVFEGPVGSLVMPKDGLVFYVPLNENSATAKTGQTLISSNVSYTTVGGVPCCLFSGNNSSYIFSSDNTNLPLSNQPSTLSCWFRLKDTNNTNQMFFAYGSGSNDSMRGLCCFQGSSRYFASALWGASGDNMSNVQAELNKWYHVACIFGDNYQKLYLNGSLIKELSYSGMNTSFEKISLGGYFYAGGSTLQEYCNCYLASARIYNRVLTTDEITLLSREFDNAYVDKNTVLYIPMYGDNPFEDKSRNSYQVTNYNVTAVTNEHPAKSKGAGYFSANGQYLYINSNILSGLTTFTLDFDYKLTTLPSGGDEWQQGYYFAANGENYADPGCDMYFATSQIVISFDAYSYRVNTPYTPDTNWHKLKITRDASNLVSVYQDNNLLKSYTESRSFYTGNYGFAIGRVEPQGEGGGAGFHGYIANYRISNIARVVENKLDNSSLMFSLDAKRGLQDNSSNPCTLENHGVTTSNDCFVFDGSSYITTNQASKLNLGTGDFTIEIVMNLSTGNSSKNYPTLIGGKDGWNTGANGIRWNGTHHRSGFAVFLNPSDPLMRSNTTFTPNDGTFITYVLQRNAGVWSQYFDGIKDSTTVSDSREYDLSHSSGMSIGCSTWDGANGYHVGLIKSIKIWNKAKYL